MEKILIIMNNLAGGGAEKALIKLLEKIDKDKYCITLFLLNNEGIYLKELKKYKNLNFAYLTEELNKSNRFYKIKKVIHKLKKLYFCLYPNYAFTKKLGKNKYDVGIAYLEGVTTLFSANLKNCKKKIAWVHTDLIKNKSLNKILEKGAYKKINRIICVSNDAKSSMIKLYPNLYKKIEVIYNPIDKEEIIEKSKEYKKIFNDKKLNIISIGRLIDAKGYDILLQAHNLLIKKGLNYKLYILGEGKERKKLEKYIEKNNLENYTQLLGFKENPYPYLKEADIFVSSSRYEGYPLVLCEAICLEKPIIATNCTGPKEILENGKYGLIAEVENIEDLAEKMEELILNKELRNSYSVLVKKKAETFNISRIMKEIERELNERNKNKCNSTCL